MVMMLPSRLAFQRMPKRGSGWWRSRAGTSGKTCDTGCKICRRRQWRRKNKNIHNPRWHKECGWTNTALLDSLQSLIRFLTFSHAVYNPVGDSPPPTLCPPLLPNLLWGILIHLGPLVVDEIILTLPWSLTGVSICTTRWPLHLAGD